MRNTTSFERGETTNLVLKGFPKEKVANKTLSRVAKGEESGQPAAADMRELVWDDELEAIAQR